MAPPMAEAPPPPGTGALEESFSTYAMIPFFLLLFPADRPSENGAGRHNQHTARGDQRSQAQALRLIGHFHRVAPLRQLYGQKRVKQFPRLRLLPVHKHRPSLVVGDAGIEKSRLIHVNAAL